MYIKFGTDGYRGIIGDNFNFDIVKRISLSLAEYFNDGSPKTVAIGYDTRFLSKEFAVAAAEAIVSKGINVILSDDFCPSPVLSYFVKKNKCDAGIMITASHNPFIFNGLKFKSRFGASMLESEVKKIEKILNNNIENSNEKNKNLHSKTKPAGNLKRENFKDDYISHIIKFTGIHRALENAGKDLLKSIDVIIDPMFGAGIGYLPPLLKSLCLDYCCVNCEVNPNFPGLNPEPIDHNLRALKSILTKRGVKNKFSVGFATDGDADRIGAVDYKGNFIDSHKIFSIILNYLIQEGYSGSVVKTVSVSKSVDDICRKHNIKLHETPIGFKNIAELMIKKGSDVFIGGEESGGIGITSHLPERDGIFNALMLLKIIITTGKNLNELLDDIYNEPYPYIYKRDDLHIEEDKKGRLIEKLKEGSFNIPFKEDLCASNFIDGFKFEYNDNSWLLIRPSGTEPVLRIYAESKDENKTGLLINKVKNEIDNL